MNFRTRIGALDFRSFFWIGLMLTLTVTSLEVFRGTHFNFLVFANSTLDFWHGISPYTDDFIVRNGREFLYSPVFSVLFTPFAILPACVGAYVWNIFNFVMFFLAVKNLPDEMFPYRVRSGLFLYTILLLGQSLLCFQFNIVVAYLFLFAWTALEKKHDLSAVILILISGLTKVYGIFEIILLLCYTKRLWRNIGYVIVVSAVLLALPLLKLPISGLVPYYQEWIDALDAHQSSRIFESFFFAEPFSAYLLPHFRLIQLGTLAVLGILFIAKYSRWSDWRFRVQVLGVIMGWVVLMSDSAEIHTYIIAVTGFGLWYWSRMRHSLFDKILLWVVFCLFCIVPVDVLCPVPVMEFITRTLWLHVYLFTFVWIRMVVMTVTDSYPIPEEGVRTDSVSDLQRIGGEIDLVCPCYNPPQGFIGILSETVAKLRSLHPERRFHLIVSDDGSSRGFGSDVREKLLNAIPDSEIVDNPHRGKGSAVRGGMARSRAPFVIYTDIDMPYTFESIANVVEILGTGFDLVVSVRDRRYYRLLPLYRKILSFGSKMLNRILICSSHPDTQGGLKGLSARGRDIMLQTTVDGFLFDAEFVRKCVNSGLNVVDVDVSLNDGIEMSNFSGKVIFRELGSFIRIVFAK